MFHCLRIFKCTFFKLQYLSRGTLPTSKGVSTHGSLLEVQFETTILHDLFKCLHIPCVLHQNKQYCEKGIASAKRLVFDIEIAKSYFNGTI